MQRPSSLSPQALHASQGFTAAAAAYEGQLAGEAAEPMAVDQEDNVQVGFCDDLNFACRRSFGGEGCKMACS